jgi:hypothetical protein
MIHHFRLSALVGLSHELGDAFLNVEAGCLLRETDNDGAGPLALCSSSRPKLSASRSSVNQILGFRLASATGNNRPNEVCHGLLPFVL